MLQFYGYKGSYEYGKEPCGTEHKFIWRDLKTVRGALRRAKKYFGSDFRLYTFTNIYNDSTFKEVK